MSNFDDWGTPNDDWGGGGKKNSDFEFNWDPEGNFQHAPPPKKSPIKFISSQPIWIKLVAGLGALVLVAFIVVQAGVITKLRTFGLLRQTVSTATACLNSIQVISEISAGVINQASMSRAIDHATTLKSQKTGDEKVDTAMWAVADAAFLAQAAFESLAEGVTFNDVLAGDLTQQFATPEVVEASNALTSSAEQLSEVCRNLSSGTNQAPSPVEETPDQNQEPSEGPSEEPSQNDQVAEPEAVTPPSGPADVDAIKAATFRVDCISGGALGTAFIVDLSSLTGSSADSRLIITNHHVIEGCISDGFVYLSQEDEEFSADIVSYDSVLDIAILDASGFTPSVVLQPNMTYQVGEEVITSGHPDGIKTAITFGRITLFDEDEYLIFSDALAGPGSSGGPMLNANGEVIGIVTYILEVTTGMSLASPIDAICSELLTCP